MVIQTLIGARSEDLESPEPEVRRKALETFARNERILFGKVSPWTESELRRLEVCPPESPADISR
jgi:hypothetical protein